MVGRGVLSDATARATAEDIRGEHTSYNMGRNLIVAYQRENHDRAHGRPETSMNREDNQVYDHLLGARYAEV